VYLAEKLLPELVARIEASIRTITEDFEIILVDDRSPDHSWQVVEELALQYPRLRGLRLSRNFGQHSAITAGLDHCRGQWVVVMDCDLQDRPEEIPALYAEAQKGFDLVIAQRANRQDSWLKKSLSGLFYRSLAYLTDTRQDSTTANFGIYNRRVVDALCRMRESARYFPTMIRWVGFRSTTLPVTHAPRPSGKSSYGFSQKLHLALDTILAYSDKPLRLTIKLGLFISATAFIGVFYTLFRWLEGKITVLGYASLITSIWFFSGLIIFLLGVVGLYIGKTFEGVKNRPLYIIDQDLRAALSNDTR
jgi:dolichol-phosphate mannosyltransferase